MVIADALIFPNHQASATIMHRKTQLKIGILIENHINHISHYIQFHSNGNTRFSMRLMYWIDLILLFQVMNP